MAYCSIRLPLAEIYLHNEWTNSCAGDNKTQLCVIHSELDWLTLGSSELRILLIATMTSTDVKMAPLNNPLSVTRVEDSEATENQYGHVTTVSDPDHALQRQMKPRHINMFAIAGSLGTGIIIAMGRALAAGGPGNVLFAFVVMSFSTFFVMTALAEMAVFAPHAKGFSGYATRYLDPAVG